MLSWKFISILEKGDVVKDSGNGTEYLINRRKLFGYMRLKTCIFEEIQCLTLCVLFDVITGDV